jgi:acyl carrier protein
MGLPALAVDWGVVRDVGVVANSPALALHLENLGLVPLSACDMLDALGVLLQSSVAQSTVLRADWSRVRQSFPVLRESPRLSLLHSASRADESADGLNDGASLQQVLLGMPAADRHARLQIMVCEAVARVMGTSPVKLDVDEPMTKIGMDSLMAVELATRIKKEMQVDIPTMTFMRGPSITQLTSSLLDLLLQTQRSEMTESAQYRERELAAQPTP